MDNQTAQNRLRQIRHKEVKMVMDAIQLLYAEADIQEGLVVIAEHNGDRCKLQEYMQNLARTTIRINKIKQAVFGKDM